MISATVRRRGIVLAVALAGASSCIVNGGAWGGDRGSGVAASQTRTVGEFRRIEVRGSTDVAVTAGRATSVVVTGDDNLLRYVVTEVAGGTLVIRQESGSHSPRVKLLVTVSTPALEGVAIHGSADVTVHGLSAERFRAHIAGSGDLAVAGRTGELEASVSGSGDMRLYDLLAQRAAVKIAGSGDVQVNVQQTLEARISGSGDVRYRGDPHTQISVHGSGSVRRG
jgi:hypothetical protein